MTKRPSRTTPRKKTPSRALALIALLVAAGGAAVVALRQPSARGVVADAFADLSAVGSDTAAAPAKPVVPPRPRRAMVPDVEVVVNIPSGRLELRDSGRVVKSYPVSVGSAKYSTPVGGYLLATVIWNPWWHPPEESVWAKDRKPMPPGPTNPMGRVKLNIDELYYIHGTTAEGRLGAPASHGCIRMANRDVVDLAKRLYRYSSPGITDARLDALAAQDGHTREDVMARTVRMRVTYQVARVSDDTLRVHPDVYGRVGAAYTDQVRQALAENGYSEPLTGPAVGRLLQVAGGERSAAFALKDLPTLQPRAPRPHPADTLRLLGTPVAPAPATPSADTAAARRDELPASVRPPLP